MTIFQHFDFVNFS